MERIVGLWYLVIVNQGDGGEEAAKDNEERYAFGIA